MSAPTTTQAASTATATTTAYGISTVMAASREEVPEDRCRAQRHVLTAPSGTQVAGQSVSGRAVLPYRLLVLAVVVGEAPWLAIGLHDLTDQLEDVRRRIEPFAPVGAAAGELSVPLLL